MRIVKALAVALALALAVSVSYAQITVPNTFAPGTTIRSAEVNTNFSELGTKALNRTGGTMTGHLLFTDNTYDIGASGATRPRRIYVGTEVVSPLFSGSGASLTDIPWAAVLKAGSSLADLATRSASDLSSGTLPDARFPATLPAISGANLTTLNGTNIASGTVADARIASTITRYNADTEFTTSYKRFVGTTTPTRSTAGPGVEIGIFSNTGYVQSVDQTDTLQPIRLRGSDTYLDASANAYVRVNGGNRVTVTETTTTVGNNLAASGTLVWSTQSISSFTHEESALAVTSYLLTYTEIDAHKHLRGIVAGTSGQTIRIYNNYNSTRNIVLGTECTSASAANRLVGKSDGVTTPTTCSGGVTVGFGTFVDLVYFNSRWHVLSAKSW